MSNKMTGARCFLCLSEIAVGEKTATLEVVETMVVTHETCATKHYKSELAEKTRHVVRSTNPQPIKEKIMAESTTPETPEADIVDAEIVTEPTRLQSFVNKHPRAAKVVAITGGVLAVAGTAQFARTVKANRSHVLAAGTNAKEALSELSTSVTPATPTDV